MAIVNTLYANPLLAAASILFLIVAAVLWTGGERPLSKIDGPRSNIFVGIGLSLPPHATQKLREWAQQYGEVYKIRVGWYHWVVLNSPEAIKEVFDRQTFVPVQTLEIKQLVYDLAFNNFNDAAFYGHLRRALFSIMMTAVYGRRIDRMDHEDIKYSEQSGKLLGKLGKAGTFIEDEIPLLAKLPTWMQPSRKKALEHAKWVLWVKMRMWNTLQEQFDKDAATPCYGVDIMRSDYASQGLQKEDCAWIAGGLVEAGSQTSAGTLSNLILYLAATPSAQETAFQEVQKVVGESRAPTYDDLENLPYINACVKEILRLCPAPPWILRHFTDQEVVYKDYVIPKGTAVVGNTAAIHFDPIQYPDPFKFKPERYVHHTKRAAEYAAMADPYVRDHFTFGAGRRICPGSRFAENALTLALANMVWAFEIKPPPGVVEMNLSDDAFDEAPLKSAKPFKAVFSLRSEGRLERVKEDWLAYRGLESAKAVVVSSSRLQSPTHRDLNGLNPSIYVHAPSTAVRVSFIRKAGKPSPSLPDVGLTPPALRGERMSTLEMRQLDSIRRSINMAKYVPNPLPDLPRPTKAYHKTVYPYISPERPELNMSGKTLFITGGAGMIGRGICKAFAQAGVARMIIIGRTLLSLNEVKSDIESKYSNIEVSVHAADVTDNTVIQPIIRAAGKIDIVVSAAHISHRVTPTSTIDPSVLSEMLQTNTVGPFLVFSAILHERAIQGWDHEVKIIFVSSALSHIHISHLSGYSASKAAMNILVSHLNVQWNSRGVSIFAIHPGVIFSPSTAKVFPAESPIWEDSSLSAGFCVWLCHPEAAFLSGKFLWAQWDVPELLAQKEWIEKNPWHLEMGLNLPSTERPTKDFFIVDSRVKQN
ncbi:hypothetical protein G7Y89_g10016 [Cudoniella acicularis]|uniref:Cytochrome P450 n=1 Tax=Cudoniella acicularis TaxID=354080 RepID=A0A8H4VZ48_9HELO|nr:hypothetical protein G7Y89_g10016 [Cudoniella acicularis]